MGQPVWVRVQRSIDDLPVQAQLSQFRAHSNGALTPRRMKTNEIFRVASIVNQLLGAQTFYDGAGSGRIVSLVDQLTVQMPGRAIAPRQKIERHPPRGA